MLSMIDNNTSVLTNQLSTTQEEFWAGAFGDDYIDRNVGESLIASNIALFSGVMRYTSDVQSILEFGPNIGLNLIALHSLLPRATMTGVEINTKAYSVLKTLNFVEAINKSFLNVSLDRKWDFVFTKGVLIHQSPDVLNQVYERLYKYSNRYIFLCEYYNPTPLEISYRGHSSVMYKSDFAGEIMDMYSDLTLVDYGFVYHRDCTFPGDDVNWFLLEKE